MANHTERIGVHHCGEIAEQNEWMFCEQPINDIGIDAHMELVDTTGAPKQLLALQIKTGKSWFNKQKDGNVIFSKINERQYNYWTMNTLPCIIVLYNDKDNTCIWQKLTSETIKKTKSGKGKGYVVNVPLTQVFLDVNTNKKLLAFSTLPQHITNYNFLLSQKRFMQIIRNGGEVKLHSTEWVNKSSGRGETELIVNDGKTIETYKYPYWFPFTCYTDMFPRLFPWADFSADEDFFEEDDRSTWCEYHCHYDKEDNEWLNVGDTFEEYREKLSPMRSIDHSGEVAEYMMILGLNELGKAFLAIDEFVSQKRPYADTRPSDE